MDRHDRAHYVEFKIKLFATFMDYSPKVLTHIEDKNGPLQPLNAYFIKFDYFLT